MVKNLKMLPLAALMGLSTQAFAISVNISDFTFHGPASVRFTDTLTGVTYNGAAGQFTGTLGAAAPAVAAQAKSLAVQAAAPTSFTAYCTEITQEFFLGQTYQYTPEAGSVYYSAQKETDLSRLFTATAGFVTDAATSAAVQAAVWEIVYEQGTSYNLDSGKVTVFANDADDQAAFLAVNTILANLDSYNASYNVNTLVNPTAQDFVVATIPEPGTWALMVGGLGVLGFMAKRRKR